MDKEVKSLNPSKGPKKQLMKFAIQRFTPPRWMEQEWNIFLSISLLIKSSSQDESLEKDWLLSVNQDETELPGLFPHLVSIDGPG